jgi:hypothetical protein
VVGAEQLDEARGQRTGPTADVERALSWSDARGLRERIGELGAVAPDAPLVALCRQVPAQ